MGKIARILGMGADGPARRRRRFTLGLWTVGVAGWLLAGHAAQAAPADAQVDRLATAGHSLKWNWTPPGRGERYGHAEVLINAPIAAVRAQVTDFPHYKEFAPEKFQNARMVAKDGPNVDIETYAFLTTTPNPLVATINHERMPVLLTREEEFETWLRGSPDEAFALAREYPADQMRVVQEGLDKEDLLRAG